MLSGLESVGGQRDEVATDIHADHRRQQIEPERSAVEGLRQGVLAMDRRDAG